MFLFLKVTKLCDLAADGDSVTSVSWSERVSHQFAHGSFYAMIMIALISSLSNNMPTTVLIESDEMYLLFTGWEVRIGKYYVMRLWLWPEVTRQSSQFFPNTI